MNKLKDTMFRLRIFIWYLVTEPFRQLAAVFSMALDTLNNLTSWIYIVFILAIIALFQGNNYAGMVWGIFVLILFLVFEWNSGEFMHKYRQNVKKRIKRVMEEKEGKLIEGEKK